MNGGKRGASTSKVTRRKWLKYIRKTRARKQRGCFTSSTSTSNNANRLLGEATTNGELIPRNTTQDVPAAMITI